MASTRLIKAVEKVRYTKNLYNPAHLESLAQAIEKESTELKNKVFGKENQLNQVDFLREIAKEIEWLDTFWHIRERLHRRAQVKMLHENKEELEKHLERELI